MVTQNTEKQGTSSINDSKAKPVTRKRLASQIPVVLDSGSVVKKPLLKQGTTWAGIFTIAAAIASGGASALLDPTIFTMIGSGVALLFAEN